MSTPEAPPAAPVGAPPTRGRKERRTAAVLQGAGGLLLLLLGILLLRLLGLAAFPLSTWAAAAVLTAAVCAVLWLIPQLELDARMPWDPRYVLVPLLLTSVLLNVYIYIAPELRALPLVTWPIALLFMVGLVGFWGVIGTSALMGAGYLLAASLLVREGAPLSMAREAGIAFGFICICGYAGGVFQRLRRERVERHELRARLSEMALTDPLTRLPNRRQLEDTLSSEVSRVQRYGGECSLALIDVDHFKVYNDSLGHPAGDAVLHELARLMRRHVRVTDVLARYGGEEFALVMVNTPKEEALAGVERLRATVEKYPFPDEHVLPGGRLTVSAGVSSCPTDTTEYHDLVKLADDALYRAKRTGRNRVRAGET